MTHATHVFKDELTLFREAARRFIEVGQGAIHERGEFHVALAGGTTPAGLYRELSRPEQAGQLDWSRVFVYFGDERTVPPDHPDSNYRLAWETLLSRVPVPEGQVHRMAGEHDDPQEAAAAYTQILSGLVPHSEAAVPHFDLILLGLGPDGHVASLFPGTDILGLRRVTCAAVFVEKLNSWRISLTLPILDNARQLMLLVSGAPKAAIVQRVFHPAAGDEPLPVEMIHPRGTVEWFLDAEAARYLRTEPQG